MFVTRENGVVTLRPANENERAALVAFFEDIPENTKLDGTTTTKDPGREYGKFVGVELHFGERLLVVTGTDDEDAYRVNGIRNMGYFGSCAPIYVRQDSGDELVVTLFQAVPCKLCNGWIYEAGQAEWEVCDACAEKCEHEYTKEPGTVMIPGVGPSADHFCTKCGRAQNPEKLSKMTPEEHHRAAVEEGPIDLLMTNDALYSKREPSQVA